MQDSRYLNSRRSVDQLRTVAWAIDRTGMDRLGCGVAGFVVFLLGVSGVIKGGFLRFLLHVLITAMLVVATAGW